MTEEERYNCWTWHCGFKTESMKCFACNDVYIYREGPNKHGWVRSLIIRNGIEIAPNVVPICKSCSALSHNYRDLLVFMNAEKKTLTEEQVEKCRKHLKSWFHHFIDHEDESEFDNHEQHCTLCFHLEKNEKEKAEKTKAEKNKKRRVVKRSQDDDAIVNDLKQFKQDVVTAVVESNKRQRSN